MNKTHVTIYLVSAWVFLAAVVAQVLLVGLVVVARQMSWELHIGFGHMVGVPILPMLITVYLGKLPGNMKRLTWLLFAVFFVQAEVIIFMRDAFPYVAAFHPVLALLDFAIAWNLIKQASALLRSGQPLTKEPIQVAGQRAN